jgi:hypothetical protein
MSAMARAASALCLAELSPWIYKHYFSIFQSVIGLLVKFTATRKQSVLPENPGTSQMTSPVRSSCGLALGIVLDKLVSEFNEPEIGHLLGDLFETLKASAFNDQNCGAVVAISVLIKVLIKLSGNELERAKVLYSDLKQMIDRTKSELHLAECCCLSFSSASLYLYYANLLSDDDVLQSLAVVRELQKCHSKVPCISASLGGLICGLTSWGLTDIIESGKELMQEWLSAVSVEAEPELWLPDMWGLMGLFGCLNQIPVGRSAGNIFNAGLSDLVKLLKKLVSSSKSEACSNAAWFIGLLVSTTGRDSDSSTVPANYEYLPETSIMRSAYERLCMAAKTVSQSIELSLQPLMSALSAVVKGKFPPVDWDSVLTTLMHSQSEAVMQMCLKFTLAHSLSGNVMSFLKPYLSKLKFNSLSLSCRKLLLLCLPGCIHIISRRQLETVCLEIVLPLFETVCHSSGNQDISLDLCHEALLTLSTALQVKELFPQAQHVLCNTVRRTFNHFLHWPEDDVYKCMEAVADCLARLPSDILRQVLTSSTSEMEEHGIAVVHSITSLIVKGHNFSLSWLEQPISYLLSHACHCGTDVSARFKMTLDHVLAALWRSGCTMSAAGQEIDIVVWSLELMGYVRSLIQNDQEIACQTMMIALVLLCQMWSAGVSPKDKFLQHPETPMDLTILPSVFSRLIVAKGWSTSIDKLVSWLCWASSLCTKSTVLLSIFEACLCELQHYHYCRQALPTLDLLRFV